MGALKSRELTTREWTRRHEETWVDNAGVAKHEQRKGMSRNHTERQQLNAPVTHAPALSVDYKSKHCLTRWTVNILVCYSTVMELEYKQTRKGSGFVYVCANMLYRRVKTEGNIFYFSALYISVSLFVPCLPEWRINVFICYGNVL